jgi:hypothetical protein
MRIVSYARTSYSFSGTRLRLMRPYAAWTFAHALVQSL